MDRLEELIQELNTEEEKLASIRAQISNYNQKKTHTPDEEQWYNKVTRAKLFTQTKIDRLKRDISLERDTMVQSYRICYSKLKEILPPEIFEEFIRNTRIG